MKYDRLVLCTKYFYLFAKRSNEVSAISSVSFLAFCARLNDVNLSLNPISRTNNYRNEVKRVVPQLLILDGFGFNEADRPIEPVSTSEYSSSLTSNLSRDVSENSSNNLECETTAQRASSATDCRTEMVMVEIKDRPLSAIGM